MKNIAPTAQSCVGGWVDRLACENGLLELLGLQGLVLAATLFVLRNGLRRSLQFWHVPFLLLLLAEREAPEGFDWVSVAVLDPRHWSGIGWSPTAALQALLLAGTAWATVTFVLSGLPAVIWGARMRAAWTASFLGAIGLAGLGQVAEEFAAAFPASALLLEEGLETLSVLLLLLAILTATRALSPGRDASVAGARPSRAGAPTTADHRTGVPCTR